MEAHINNQRVELNSEQDLSNFLDAIDINQNAEVWLKSKSGSSICLLKNGEFVFLMYLRFETDSGFVSLSKQPAEGMIEFTLANGQVDEYPKSWCIEKEYAYKALAYFFVNSGEQSTYIQWQAS